MFLNTEFSVAIACTCLAAALVKCAINETEEVLLKRSHLECIEETRVDPDYIQRIKKGDWKIPKEHRQLVKNWALCVMMKQNLMTPQGVYKIDVALSKVPVYDRDAVEKSIDACLSTKAIPAPDIAYYFVKCYQRTRGNYTVTILPAIPRTTVIIGGDDEFMDSLDNATNYFWASELDVLD